MKCKSFVILLLVLNAQAYAAQVDTIRIYSQAMKKEFRCVVISPTLEPGKKQALPVVYLLHGYSGKYSNWIIIVPQLKDYADQHQLMIVCPDGGYGSWYFDSPVDSSFRYETYIGKEVPAFIDSHYPTIKDRKARAITGLSMGGHGGLFLGLRHPEIFGACGSMSGGVDLRPFRKNWDISKRIGDSTLYPQNWKNYSVITIAEQKKEPLPKIIFDCGTDDFFYDVNRALHEKMLALKIPHEYIERPGKHDWVYWANSVQFHLLYFSNYFKSVNK